jgi:saccharopine dehydrogenase-like NADP-dependent oxidoreductase
MKKAIVLGCGQVGQAIVRDLASDPGFEVTAADAREAPLRRVEELACVKTRQVDLSDPKNVRDVVSDFDIVLGALPSRFGFAALQAVIEAKKPYCDISFLPEDALALDAVAKAAGTTAIIDSGVSPGMSNLLVGYAEKQMDQAENAVIYVGGLPKERSWPYQYKAPFAPSDVIEEYTRPARMIENGGVVVKPALTEPELIEFPKAGTLEAFNTDGLRTLLTTVNIPNMKEKTLRYPGHIELMRIFRESGFFGKEKIEVGGVSISPLDVTSKLLFREWAFEEGEEEFTVMRVQVEGKKGEEGVRYTYDLYDEYDHASNLASMARATAFPCTILARWLSRGDRVEPGVYPLELLARKKGVVKLLMDELAARGVTITERIELTSNR